MTWNQIKGLSFTHSGKEFITPNTDEDAQNLLGVRYLQATTAGSIVFRLADGGLSVACPIGAGQTRGIGRLEVAVYSSTASDLIPYYDTEL